MKTGIVFEGGANRTIFSMGVADALLEEDIKTDFLIGSSAGIAYGVNFASRQKGRTLQIMTNYLNDKRYMGVKHLIDRKNKSYFNLDFTYREIPENLIPFNYEEYKRYPQTPEAAVTNMLTGKTDYIPVDDEKEDFKSLQASCALPLLFPIIKVNDTPYMDGGLSDPIPYKRAFEAGCEKLIVVLTRERNYKKGPESLKWLLKLKYSDYPKFLEVMNNRPDVYNTQKRELFDLEKKGKVFLIMPETTKDFSRLEKNIDNINNMYKDGYLKMKNRSEELKEFLK